jgi:hypothetical protein
MVPRAMTMSCGAQKINPFATRPPSPADIHGATPFGKNIHAARW